MEVEPSCARGAADSKNFLSFRREEQLDISPESLTSEAFIRATRRSLYALALKQIVLVKL